MPPLHHALLVQVMPSAVIPPLLPLLVPLDSIYLDKLPVLLVLPTLLNAQLDLQWSLVMLDSSILTELVSLAQQTLPLVLPPLTELLVKLDSTYQLHG
jgi:hypothetical protein